MTVEGPRSSRSQTALGKLRMLNGGGGELINRRDSLDSPEWAWFIFAICRARSHSDPQTLMFIPGFSKS